MTAIKLHSLINEKNNVESRRLTICLDYGIVCYTNYHFLKHMFEKENLKLKVFKKKKNTIYYRFIAKI